MLIGEIRCCMVCCLAVVDRGVVWYLAVCVAEWFGEGDLVFVGVGLGVG